MNDIEHPIETPAEVIDAIIIPFVRRFLTLNVREEDDRVGHSHFLTFGTPADFDHHNLTRVYSAFYIEDRETWKRNKKARDMMHEEMVKTLMFGIVDRVKELDALKHSFWARLKFLFQPK